MNIRFLPRSKTFYVIAGTVLAVVVTAKAMKRSAAAGTGSAPGQLEP